MLSRKVSLYVPSTHSVGKPLPEGKHDSLVRDVAKEFSKFFGGATATQGEGFYTANNGDLIRERVTIVTSYHDKTTQEALAIVIPIAQVIKTRYGQEAIAIETEQGIDFI
jgi:hypothetical protein